MKVLVTGATGFIGTHLCHRLHREGHTLVALVRDPKKASALPRENVELLEGDLSLFARDRLELPACDAVVHLAGLVAAEKLSDYREINYLAVERLVECLQRQRWKPRRFLFASSLAAAGPCTDGVAKSETDPSMPVEPYGASKLEAEQYLKRAPFATTSFRPALVLGEGDAATLTLFKMARRGLGFRVAGANPKLSFVDIEDLVDALMKMLADDSSAHRLYFVSHPQVADNLAIWRSLAKAMNREVRTVPVPRPALYLAMVLMTGLSRVFRFKNQLDSKQYQQLTAPGFVCSSAALQRELSWQPRHDLDAAIARAARGFEKAGWLEESAKAPS